MLDGDLKTVKEVKFNYSTYLISSNGVRSAQVSELDSVPKVRATLHKELHFSRFIHIHHTLEKIQMSSM